MLNDELQQCKSSFAGKKGSFQVRFFLQASQDKNKLIIQLQNQSNLQHFRLAIDSTYIQDNPQLSFCFETPQDIFYTLMQLFQDVSLTTEGLISFEMKLNATKLKKKIFRLQCEKYIVDQSQLEKIKLQTFKRELKAEIANRDDRINILLRKSQLQQDSILQLREEVKELKIEQENLYLENKKQDFKISAMNKEIQQERADSLAMRKSLDQFQKKFNILEFYSFFQNPHWHYFSIIKLPNSARIIKKDNDNTWSSFIRNMPLPVGKVTQLKIKQIRTNYRNIMIGVATRQGFGSSNAYKQKYSVAYNSYSGNIWENGASRKGGSGVNDGQIIAVDANLSTFRISWTVDGKKYGEAIIGQQFKNKQIFLFLQFYNVQDQLELIL